MKKPDKISKYSGAGMSLENMLFTGLIFCLLMAALCLVQLSVPYSMREESIQLLPTEDVQDIKLSADKEASGAPAYVVLVEGEDLSSQNAVQVIDPVLTQMKLSFELVEVSDFSAEGLSRCENLILAVNHYSYLSDFLGELKSWVKQGGNLMILFPPEYSGNFMALFDILGIKECGTTEIINEVRFKNDFMIGGEDRTYPITDAYQSSYALTISADSTVYMESTDDYGIPLVWKRDCGQGSVVFDNFGIMEKSYRGIHCAALSLLGDACVYPVINGAVFYIDDFPSPVPEGDGVYITRDFNMSIGDFYSQVWWNDVYDLARLHNIRYTGLVIEEYSDQVSGVFKRNQETDRYLYFGNLLLQSGGEIGIHGYNHMPLVLQNFDYEDQYDDYVPWPSAEDMRHGVQEVISFTNGVFPKEKVQVYVPPSNILSEEGRAVLADADIRAIASVYLAGDLAYEQEFDVSKEDGIVNTPRVISGYVFNDFTNLTALSELNFHLVSTHFQHPDDVLDEDRGAELGWKEMRSRLADYMNWLYDSFPDIRNLTGSELAGAVERYDLIEVERTATEKGIHLELSNYYDEAYMMLRLNRGQVIDGIVGGTFTRINDSLYLIDCKESQVDISVK